MAMSVPSSRPASGSNPETTNVRAMSIATMLFFMWGFLTSLNDILIPHLKSIFDLGYAQAMLVQFASFSSYAIFAWPAGKLVERIGYKRTMVVGLVIMAVGALLFIPAAKITVFGLFAYEQARTYATNGRAVPTAITAAVVLVGMIVAWRLINAPKSVDFLISTDSEMKKVNWPSREELWGSTRIVILFLFVIALLLFLIDVAAGAFFQAIHLLKFGILG